MITPDFAAYAIGIDVHFHRAVSVADLTGKVEGLLSRIASECVTAGAYLIGHIKCVVETDDKGYLAVSVVDAARPPQKRGGLEEGFGEADIIVNVLLYGLSRSRIQEIVDPLVHEMLSFPGAHLHIEDLEKEHQHEDHGDHDHEHGHHHDHH
ncbi:MAG: hypothetical protein ISF22_03350 [Methanomassiliicoccus sp.]|nr:hypothetical protein [Methanomassiliicoccus sp.]